MTEFTELSDADFKQTITTQKLAMVDYYASWCGACRMAAPMFKRVAGELGLSLFKIDAEKNPDSRDGVDIQNLPTVALVKDGKIVGSLTTTREESLREFFKEHGVG